VTDTSGWTTDALRSYFIERIADMRVLADETDRRYQQRFEAQEQALGLAIDAAAKFAQAALDATDLRTQQRFDGQEKALDIALETAKAEFVYHVDSVRAETKIASDAANKAIEKAEMATEKRFEGVNEFRHALDDQTKTFIPRVEAEAAANRNAERTQALTITMQSLVGRAELDSAIKGQADKYDGLYERNAERLNVLSNQLPTLIPRAEVKVLMDGLTGRLESALDTIQGLSNTLLQLRSQTAGKNTGTSDAQKAADRTRNLLISVVGILLVVVTIVLSIYFHNSGSASSPTTTGSAVIYATAQAHGPSG
jgi:hypothetical protein